MITGKLIKNNTDKLVIIFQSRGQIPTDKMEDILHKRISKEEVSLLHRRYNWFTLSEEIDADFLFVEDYFSECHGWYMINSGKSIINEFNESLTDYIITHNYKEAIAFGSSKGGTGALLYGLINPMVNKTLALVPQVKVVDYIEKHMKKYKELFFPEHVPEFEKDMNEIFFNAAIYNYSYTLNKQIYLYTGIEDEQFREAIQLNVLLTQKVHKSNIFINTSFKEHNPLVLDNLNFFEKLLRAIIHDQEINDERIVNINQGIFLLKDK